MPPLEMPEHELVRALVGRLPPDVLIRIFAAVPARERQDVVPLVCKLWHEAATEPSRLFARVKVDLTWPGVPLQPSLEQWLASRTGFLQSLAMALPPESGSCAAAAVRALAGASVAPQLCRLVIDFRNAEAEAAGQLLAALADAPRVAGSLKALSIKKVRGELRLVKLDSTLQLSRLCFFKLTFAAAPQAPINWMPEGFPSFLLACSKLRDLFIFGAGSAALVDPSEELSRLQHLQRLSLQGTGVQTLPASLTSLSSLRTLKEWAQLLDGLRLQELRLRSCWLLSMPDAIMRHASLRCLSLRGCRLAELPPKPYLQRLKHLDLRNNLFTRVPQAALAAPRLRTLQMLQDCEELDLTLEGQSAFAAALEAANAALHSLNAQDQGLADGGLQRLRLMATGRASVLHKLGLPCLQY